VTTHRARLILNPVAGADRALDHAARLSATLSERFGPMEVAITAGPGDAESAAARAVDDGCTHVFVAGGDGTLNEALNGVVSQAGGLDQVTFGIIPLGTGNDFARALGIPAEIDDAIASLMRANVVHVDAGRLNDRIFINVSGGGFIAEVSEAVTPQLKSIAGRLAYLVGGAQTLLDFEPVRMTLAAEPGGQRVGAGVYAFAVCNSRMIGGGRLIAPHASLDDGLLDVCVIDAMPTLEFVALLRRVADGGHLDDPRVRYLRASRATMQFDRRILVNTDGEVLETDRCEYEVLPKAVRFFRGSERVAPGGHEYLALTREGKRGWRDDPRA
jgi:diacylglycerol kinase (ATP)